MGAAAILRRIAKWFGIAVVALVVIFGGLFAYLKFQQSHYDVRALPFLDSVIVDLATWDYSRVLPHFADRVASELSEEQVRTLFVAFSRLGELQQYERPVFQSVHSGASTDTGSYKVVIYVTAARFENGNATITAQILDEGDQLRLYALNVDSPAILGVSSDQISRTEADDFASGME